MTALRRCNCLWSHHTRSVETRKVCTAAWAYLEYWYIYPLNGPLCGIRLRVREHIFRTNSLPFQWLHSHSHLKLKSRSHIFPSSSSRIPPIPTRQLKWDIMQCAKSSLEQILIKVVRLIFQVSMLSMLSMLVYFSSAQLTQSQAVAPPALLPLLHVTM